MGSKDNRELSVGARRRLVSSRFWPGSSARSMRAALLAGASAIAFAALGSAAASAACSNKNQTISSFTTGPIFGDWDGSKPHAGDITVKDSGGDRLGVYAKNCGIDKLLNMGSILGEPGFGDGGPAVLVNSGVTIKSLTNAAGATISGGGGAGRGVIGGSGGAGVSNRGTIATLTNSGIVTGGAGGDVEGEGLVGGAGGAGIANFGTISSLRNTGKVMGGAGGGGTNGGAGGAGSDNSGTITSLINSGTIQGGIGGSGSEASGAAGDAILSAGASASIGSITNSGEIIGNVVIDDQASVTIKGGTGMTLGSWTGGTIAIGSGDLTFAGGNTALGDNIVVNGGKGTIFNDDPLMIAAPQTITGNFDQSATGLLDFGLAGDKPGQYGALAISGSASLDGGLGIDLSGGFTLATGDSFDILNFGSLAGPGFDALAVDGVACSSPSKDMWSCGGGVSLNEMINATSLDLVVADVVGPGGGPPPAIPEPSTWAMLALGFLGLGGLGLRRRKRAGEIGLG
jgi:PEP-CTERM motif